MPEISISLLLFGRLLSTQKGTSGENLSKFYVGDSDNQPVELATLKTISSSGFVEIGSCVLDGIGGNNETNMQLEIKLSEYINKFSNLLIYYDNLYINNQYSASVNINISNFKSYSSNGILGDIGAIYVKSCSRPNAVESFGFLLINSVCLDLKVHPLSIFRHTQEKSSVTTFNTLSNVVIFNKENIINLVVYFYNSDKQYTSLKSCNIKIYGQ